jgi:medium-chain acyl-[acyl-carrier-protein] hydrolase
MCFPHAGGAASAFADWHAWMPTGIEVRPVQLPGRWNRIAEEPFTSVRDIVEALGEFIPPLLDRPFALFGHSMGALVAFEVCRYLRRHGLPAPVHLFVAGRRAPHLPETDGLSASLPQAEFLERLRKLDGIPEKVLESPELIEVLMPALRADVAACEAYRYVPEAPLGCPIMVVGGSSDPETAGERLEAWRTHTSKAFAVRVFPGGHFFLKTQPADILCAITGILNEYRPRPIQIRERGSYYAGLQSQACGEI